MCSGDGTRSQMAEVLLRALTGERFEIHRATMGARQSLSTSLRAPRSLHPLAAQVLAERGIDLGELRAKSPPEHLKQLRFAYLITLGDRAEHACPTFPRVGRLLYWPLPNPAEFSGNETLRLAKFRSLRNALEARLSEWLDLEGARPDREPLILAPAAGGSPTRR